MSINILFNRPLGSVPDGRPSIKNNPLVAAAALSGGASLVSGLLGGLFGSSSQNSANETSIAINRENNQFNANQARINRDWQSAENEKSRQFSLDQYNRELDWQKYLLGYSTPAEQRRRYEQAGINPYFALGSINSGVLQSNPSALTPSSNSATPATSSGLPSIKAYDPTNAFETAGRGISDAVNSYFRNANLAEDTRTKVIENITRLDEQRARIDKLLSGKKVDDETANKLRAQAETIDAERQYQLESLRRTNTLLAKQAHNVSADTRVKDMQAEGQELQNVWQSVENSWQQKFKFADMRKLQTDIREGLSRINLNNEQAALAGAMKVYNKWLGEVERMHFHGAQLDYQIKQKTKWAIINTAVYNAKLQQFQYDWRWLDKGSQIVSTAMQIVPFAAGAKYLLSPATSIGPKLARPSNYKGIGFR